MQTETSAKKGSKKKSNGRVNALYGFKIGELSIDALRAAVKKHKLGPKLGLDADTEEAEQVAVALAAYFDTLNVSDDDKTQCEECLGVAPDTFEDCPFCGFTGEVDVDDAPKADASGDVEAEEHEDENPPESSPDLEEVAEAKPKTKAKKAKADKASTALATSNGKHEVVHKGEVMTEKNLDEEVEEVKRLREDEFRSHWALAQKVRQLHESRLWSLRMDGKGKQRWATWEAFCLGELTMSPVAALSYIEVAKNSSEKQVQKLGLSKAYLLLKAAPEDRKDLETKVESGEIRTARELKGHVKESRAKAGDKLLDTPQKRAGSKGGKKKSAKFAKAKAATDAGKITIAKILGKSTVPLYKKPASMRGVDDFSSLKRAMKVSDVPIGKLELQNEVTLHFAVKLTSKGLVVEVNAVREVD